jgi:hypothetical protein
VSFTGGLDLAEELVMMNVKTDSKEKTKKAMRRFERCGFDRMIGLVHRGRMGFEATVEISEGGMLLEVDGKYKVGDRVEIGLFVPKGSFQTVVGTVVYVLEPSPGDRHIGVRFLQPSTQLREEIRRYVEAVK